MSRSGKTPDKTSFTVRRPLLPAGFGSKLADEAVESGHSESSSNPLAAILLRALFMLTLGLVLLPISVLCRMIFRQWTVEALVGPATMRWRAHSGGAARAGVEAVAGALTRGEPLNQSFAGLKPR